MSIATQMRRAAAGAGGAEFNPETDITWHSLFWAEGTAFQAQGYSDSDDVTTWPNETAETDATSMSHPATYDASFAGLSGQPVVHIPSPVDLAAAFGSNPTPPFTVVTVCYDSAGSGIRRVWTAPNNTQVWWLNDTHYINAGSNRSGAGTSGTGLLVRATFDGSTGNETLHENETQIVNTDAGSNGMNGVRFGWGSPTYAWLGEIALLGVYEGDITADGNWSAFTGWAAEHYGLSIA